MRSTEIYGFNERGVEYREAAGGGSMLFSKIEPWVLYEVFVQLKSIGSEKFYYYLYLYCLKKKLNISALKKHLGNEQQWQDADSLRDLAQAHQDLFDND